MKRVLARHEEHPHVLEGKQLTVSVFHEVLQDFIPEVADQTSHSPVHEKFDGKSVPQQSTQKTTQWFHLAVDPDIMEYVHESSHVDQLRTLLEDGSCVIDWTPGSKHAAIVYDWQPDGNFGECVIAAQSFLDKFVKWDVQIEEELWNILVAGSMSTVHDCLGGDPPPLLRSITEDSSFYLRIVSLKSEKELYNKNLKEVLEEIYCLEKRRNYRTEKITNLSEERIQLLRKTSFEQKLRDEFKELTVEFDDENREIFLEGPEEEVITAKIRCCVQEAKITEKELHLPKSVLEVLNTAEGLQVVKAEMAANQIEAVFVLEEDEANPRDVTAKVLGISPEHAHKASDLISSLTTETAVKIEERHLVLTTTPEWEQICGEIIKDGNVVIQRDETGRTWVAGFSKDVISCVKRLNSFLKENASEALTEEYTCPSKDARIYLRKYREKDLIAVEKKLETFDIKILDGEDAKKFVITGQKEGLSLARRMLDALIRGMLTKDIKLQQPGLRKFFSSGKGDGLVEKVEKDHECLVRVEKIFPKIKRERPTAEFVESDSMESEDDETVYAEEASASLPSNSASSLSVTTQGHNISWRTGNIAQEKVSFKRDAKRFRPAR